jgi:hypothetical protein
MTDDRDDPPARTAGPNPLPSPEPIADTHQEQQTAMLEVHAPHEAPHSWKDFFIHLGTITIGLVLALGLEQFATFLHERSEVRETRAALQAEHQENIHRFHENVRSHLTAMALMHNNLRVVAYLRAHPGTPEAQLPGTVIWPIFVEPPVKAAWATAQSTNVLGLMPPGEVRRMTADYFQLDYAWQLYQPVAAKLVQCVNYNSYTSDVTTLTPDALDRITACVNEAESLQALYGDQLSMIGKMKDYGPVPSWWRMTSFFQMSAAVERARINHDAYRQTQNDVATALSADPDPLGLGKATQDATDFLGADPKLH